MRKALWISWLWFALSSCLRFTDTPEAWPCASDADCEKHERCLLTTNRCISRDVCFLDSDCGDRELCEYERCVEKECTTNAHCEQGFACDVYGARSSPNSCYVSCERQSECATGYHCYNGSCAPNCRSDDDCGKGERCGRDNVCEPVPASCESDDDCAPYGCKAVQECWTSCTKKSECADGFTCSADWTCVPIHPCTETGCADGFSCGSDGLCAWGGCAGLECGNYACSEELQRCFVACNGDAQCSADAVCSAGGTCLKQDGAACVADDECTTEVCDVHGICGVKAAEGEPCWRDTQCLSDICDPSGLCAPQLSNGLACVRSSECLSGHCAYYGQCAVKLQLFEYCRSDDECLSKYCNPQTESCSRGLLTNGAPCTRFEECHSAYCAPDGTCTACTSADQCQGPFTWCDDVGDGICWEGP